MNVSDKSKGLLFLNEIGIDPGVDHMSAMQIIDQVHDRGGKVRHFYSFCGGLPAPEDNDNPFGYKFSWSPLAVLRAGTNEARYVKNGRLVSVPATQLFLDVHHPTGGDPRPWSNRIPEEIEVGRRRGGCHAGTLHLGSDP